MLEGFTFLRAAPALLATFLADILAMVFAQPRALFPAVAGAFFGGGVRTVGLLQAAPAIGALVGVLFSGWVSRVRRQGVAIVVAITVYAAAVGLFGLSRTIWLGVALLALSGAADMVSSAYRNTILQSAAPDAMRGRLQGVFIVVVAGGPRLGDFVAGTAASLTTPTIALLGGAAVCIVGLLHPAGPQPALPRVRLADPRAAARTQPPVTSFFSTVGQESMSGLISLHRLVVDGDELAVAERLLQLDRGERDLGRRAGTAWSESTSTVILSSASSTRRSRLQLEAGPDQQVGLVVLGGVLDPLRYSGASSGPAGTP